MVCSDIRGTFEFQEVPDFLFLVVCSSSIPSGRVRRKRVLALVCLSNCGLSTREQVISSGGESIFFISESLTVSHSEYMVQMSSIWLFDQSFPMEISSWRDGKIHPFGAALAVPVRRVHHVGLVGCCDCVLCPGQYPVMCPTVWTGRPASGKGSR